jgi:hypothetical protein
MSRRGGGEWLTSIGIAGADECVSRGADEVAIGCESRIVFAARQSPVLVVIEARQLFGRVADDRVDAFRFA